MIEANKSSKTLDNISIVNAKMASKLEDSDSNSSDFYPAPLLRPVSPAISSYSGYTDETGPPFLLPELWTDALFPQSQWNTTNQRKLQLEKVSLVDPFDIETRHRSGIIVKLKRCADSRRANQERRILKLRKKLEKLLHRYRRLVLKSLRRPKRTKIKGPRSGKRLSSSSEVSTGSNLEKCSIQSSSSTSEIRSFDSGIDACDTAGDMDSLDASDIEDLPVAQERSFGLITNDEKMKEYESNADVLEIFDSADEFEDL